MRKFLEKILLFFIGGQKVQQVKQEAFQEMKQAYKDYNAAAHRHNKRMGKYSGRKRYQKA